jgi:hypothetical protein
MKWTIMALFIATIGLSTGHAQNKKEGHKTENTKEAAKEMESTAEEVKTAPPTTRGETQPSQPQTPEQPAQPTVPAQPETEKEEKSMEAEVSGNTEERVPPKNYKKKQLKKNQSNAKK